MYIYMAYRFGIWCRMKRYEEVVEVPMLWCINLCLGWLSRDEPFGTRMECSLHMWPVFVRLRVVISFHQEGRSASNLSEIREAGGEPLYYMPAGIPDLLMAAFETWWTRRGHANKSLEEISRINFGSHVPLVSFEAGGVTSAT